MKIKILIILFLLNIVAFCKPFLLGTRKYIYDKNNNLLRFQKINGEGQLELDIKYKYDKNGKILEYKEGTTTKSFSYNENGRIDWISFDNKSYKFFYKNNVLEHYSLYGDTPYRGNYYFFLDGIKDRRILRIYDSSDRKIFVDIKGNIELVNIKAEEYDYSNIELEIVKNKDGKIMKKIWKDSKEQYIMSFQYDERGSITLIETYINI